MAFQPPLPRTPQPPLSERGRQLFLATVATGAAAVAARTLCKPVPPQSAPLSAPVVNRVDKAFWAALWQQNRIAFHKPYTNPSLVKHAKLFLGGETAQSILVPLCGKSVDLAWLAARPGVREVVGVELVERALEEFAVEHAHLKMVRTSRQGRFGRRVSTEPSCLTLLQGDILSLPGDEHYSHVWDRASLIAMAPEKREQYVAVLSRALAPGGRILLQTLARVEGPPDALRAGPPFSVDEAEVRRLYGAGYDIKRLENKDALGSNPRFKAQGLTKVTELTFLLVKKGKF
jgi:thiopurine S-methyltransferase